MAVFQSTLLTLNPGNVQLSSDEIPLPVIYTIINLFWATLVGAWFFNWVIYFKVSSSQRTAVISRQCLLNDQQLLTAVKKKLYLAEMLLLFGRLVPPFWQTCASYWADVCLLFGRHVPHVLRCLQETHVSQHADL